MILYVIVIHTYVHCNSHTLRDPRAPQRFGSTGFVSVRVAKYGTNIRNHRFVFVSHQTVAYNPVSQDQEHHIRYHLASHDETLCQQQ